MKKITRRLFLLVFLSACSSVHPAARRFLTGPLPTFVPLPSPTNDPALRDATPVPIDVVIRDSDTDCLKPILSPTRPAVIPNAGSVDQTTGRHVMGLPLVLDLQRYQLMISGLVDHSLHLTIDDLRCLPKITETVTTTCYNFQDTATWSGVLISEVLRKAGVRPGAKKIIQNGADGASRTVTLDMAMDPHNFLAYEMEHNPLPVLFGFPVRSIFVDVAGMYSVKWLTSLQVI